MIGLAFASVVTWTVWLAKNIELWAAKRRLRAALAAISAERSLAGAYARVESQRGILPTLHRCGRARAAALLRPHRQERHQGAHRLAAGRAWRLPPAAT